MVLGRPDFRSLIYLVGRFSQIDGFSSRYARFAHRRLPDSRSDNRNPDLSGGQVRLTESRPT